MPVTHSERCTFPWMPLLSHPPSPGGSVLHYLQIWNDEWKVKTCIIGNIKKAYFICRLTFKLPALFFGILKWEPHGILRVSLMNFSGIKTLLCLKAFSFLDSQGTKTPARLHQAVITWCHQLLLKNKFYAGGGTDQGNSWGKNCRFFPDFLSIAAPSYILGYIIPLPRCLCDVLTLGMLTGTPFISPPRK